MGLQAFIIKIRNLYSQINVDDSESSKFVDLAPTDTADETGVYSKALTYATKSANVFNIALTGPYGSGKSSIIKTFTKNYKKPFFPWSANRKILNISLAAFLPNADDTKSTENVPPPEPGKILENKEQKTKDTKQDLKQEIERSILQQMIYKVEAKDLPLSRFKRIQSPNSWRPALSLFILIGVLSCWYLVNQSSKILTGEFFMQFDFSNRVLWFNFSCLVAGLLLVGALIHRIYMMSFGLSIKGISLKEVAITPNAIDKESILNRHLDEIIYFFQATKYDLVVIEDLDRFDNPDIFVTLREINGLINANSGIKRKVCFLYALRDDMFTNTDRTKFFEKIIPVIPIINSTNSIDMVLKQVERLSLTKRLNHQFLREVSRYLNDLRLIINIFDEFNIYIKNLDNSDENTLDANKLLAVLIYKNILPRDFENLHRESGNLANIFKKYDELLSTSAVKYNSEINELELEVIEIEKRLPSNINELRSIYIMAILSKMPDHFYAIDAIGHNNILIKDLLLHPEIDSIIEARQISYRNNSGRYTNPINTENVQKDVDPRKNYKQRKEEIESKSAEFILQANKKIKGLKNKIYELRGAKFNETLRANPLETEELFNAFGENSELLKYLVFEGYLDDRYSDYTSLFHPGRLTNNDNKFLRKIRGFNNPEPDFHIDNPKELIETDMRPEDFSQIFVLNKTIVDFMLGNSNKYKGKIEKLLDFVASNFEECEDFFEVYYSKGLYVAEFLAELIDSWPGFVSSAIASSNNKIHVARIIAHLPEKNLNVFHLENPDLIEYISSRLADVLSSGILIDINRLKLIEFELEDLASVEIFPAVSKLLIDYGLYKISIENLEFVIKNSFKATAVDELKTQHYSTVLNTDNSSLIQKIENDFEIYLNEILLKLETNSNESVSSILKVINHDEIEIEKLREFLAKQSAKLPKLNEIPVKLNCAAIQLSKIDPTWENCLIFLSSEVFDAKVLTEYLQREDTLKSLSKLKIPDGKDAFPMRQFLIQNIDFSDEIYRSFVRMLPNQFSKIPEALDLEKLTILIEERKITFSQENFSKLEDNMDLQALFATRYIDKYLEFEEKLNIDDDFREQLLKSDIADEKKLQIIARMNLSLLIELPSRSALIGAIIYRTKADLNNITSEPAQIIVINSKPSKIQISLFNKYHSILSDEQVREIIQNMPSPFCEIKPGWRQPTIKNIPDNNEFVTWLKERKIISSSKPTLFEDEIRIYNFRD